MRSPAFISCSTSSASRSSPSPSARSGSPKAYLSFGKGMHPAGLNFGDCFTYALAKETGEPLLFKGDDFSQTDLVGV